ncbi:hypothetical protein HYC85_025889 [Camellia sinensis]|uniref:Uncharacterized protein n=1 Tax=Camellia sinensis TaxID=4442 RepID=A0A7J7G210_CAMSI|nr:hypothetical protein HYC85_025889 [Camellia sinensis]
MPSTTSASTNSSLSSNLMKPRDYPSNSYMSTPLINQASLSFFIPSPGIIIGHRVNPCSLLSPSKIKWVSLTDLYLHHVPCPLRQK